MMVPVAILAIRCYQKMAPERLRSACRFEPSCSNYSILAFQKYGFFKGVDLTARRICRCRYPNGGTDYP
ncbi:MULTISPECIES: membrane protein insertion efficiency factor YidD [unclassified Pseudomonas]|uniref:membrane protein insertion efficiency factor YidD n=1 Tax=unclassified Pseudomonas TaxID=196821 RepID=UPI001C86C191|nr:MULTISPECIES: membrane protein insertion efficiency factor YidD [unclassified Pseudomonas]MBX8467905.1 membrane protein insertion efficiency factor YidD [Pseudomonas sp. RIT778]